jgi:hypothetical protein
MNRRGFIGSLMGLVASQNFLVKLITDQPQRVILPYMLAYRDVITEQLIQCPGIKEITRKDTAVNFIAEELNVLQHLNFRSAALYTADGKFIASSNFSAPICLYSGDTLKCTYTIDIISNNSKVNLSKYTVEDIVKRKMEQNQSDRI